MENFYCEIFTEDEFLSSEEKCKYQCVNCKIKNEKWEH